MIKKILLLLMLPVLAIAGNPDRQGEAGAFELLLNPWGQTAGLNALNVSCVSGVEAMRVNPAGLGFEGRTQILLGNMQLYYGTGIQMNSIGFAQKIGKNGTMSFSLNSLSFGDLKVTTVNQPEGTGAITRPNFIQLAAGYSHSFEDKIFVGAVVRGISERVIDVSATGVALDAGVQYIGGAKRQFRLGVALRNIGPSMQYSGEGLRFQAPGSENSSVDYLTNFYFRPQKFELPTTLHLGVSYDFKFAGGRDYLRAIANFTSNAFSRDDVGVGAEYSYKKLFQLRGSYKLPLGAVESGAEDIYTGISAGFSVLLKTSKKNNNRVGVDYGFRTTRHFGGTHNLGIRLVI